MKNHFYIWKVVLFVSFFTHSLAHCYSQKKIITILPENNLKSCNKCCSKIHVSKATESTDSLANIFLDCIRSKGYISASIDSIQTKKDSVTLFYFVGINYTWKDLIISDDPLNLLSGSLLKTNNFIGKQVNYKKFTEVKRKIISVYENSGYPFVRINSDSLKTGPGFISIKSKVIKGEYITFDSLEITGARKISDKYLEHYLGIFPGKPYNEKKLVSIPRKIKELPFLKEAKPSEIFFIEKTAHVRLYLKDKKSNQFNGILGLLPDAANAGKFILTGDVSLNLTNSFKHGEQIDFTWKKLESSSQNLFVSAQWPYLFNLPLGVNASLKLFKKDSTFLNVNTHLGLPFFLNGSNTLGLYYEKGSSTLFSSTNLSSSTTLPAISGFTSHVFGISLFYSALDYKFNPRKGFVVKFQAGYGKKTIDKHPEINPALYENVVLSSFRNELTTDVVGYIPVYKNFILKLRGQLGYINSRNMVKNELYRIGGLSTLRGFDEENIYASVYGIGSTELRYLFEENSALFLFYDQAEYKDFEKNTDSPLGFGVGIEFQTGAGIFTLSYAMGKQLNNPIEFRNARIHFGFVNRF